MGQHSFPQKFYYFFQNCILIILTYSPLIILTYSPTPPRFTPFPTYLCVFLKQLNIFKENWLFPFLHQSIANNYSICSPTSSPPPFLCQDSVCSELVKVLSMLWQPLGVHMCNYPVVSRKHQFLKFIYLLYMWYNIQLLESLSLQNDLSFETNKYGISVTFRTDHSMVLYSLYLDQLSISVLIIIDFKNKLIGWKLRDVLIYEYRNKSLGAFLITRPFSRAFVAASVLSYNRSIHRFWITVPDVGFFLRSGPSIQSETGYSQTPMTCYTSSPVLSGSSQLWLAGFTDDDCFFW